MRHPRISAGVAPLATGVAPLASLSTEFDQRRGKQKRYPLADTYPDSFAPLRRYSEKVFCWDGDVMVNLLSPNFLTDARDGSGLLEPGEKRNGLNALGSARIHPSWTGCYLLGPAFSLGDDTLDNDRNYIPTGDSLPLLDVTTNNYVRQGGGLIVLLYTNSGIAEPYGSYVQSPISIIQRITSFPRIPIANNLGNCTPAVAAYLNGIQDRGGPATGAEIVESQFTHPVLNGPFGIVTGPWSHSSKYYGRFFVTQGSAVGLVKTSNVNANYDDGTPTGQLLGQCYTVVAETLGLGRIVYISSLDYFRPYTAQSKTLIKNASLWVSQLKSPVPP
jgi:hypothetical protein